MGGIEKFRRAIFALQKDDYYKSVTLLGLTLKVKRKNKKPLLETMKSVPVQDAYDLETLRSARRLIVFLVPFRDKESNELLDIFHLCRLTREWKKDSRCLVATLPGPFTYAVNENLPDEPVHRWEQVMENCSQAEELYLHLPDYCAPDFYGSLKDSEIDLLRSRPKLHLNILHQHSELMPRFESLKMWHGLTDNISLSTGLANCATQEACDRIGLPLYYHRPLLNLDSCPETDFEDKSKTILYSPDHHPMKDRVLRSLRESLPDYELRELQYSPGEGFLQALAEARFCLSFSSDPGRYYIQPYFCGSIGLTVYNELLFRDQAIRSQPFVYGTYYQLAGNLAGDISRVCRNREEYERISADLCAYFKSCASKREGLDALYSGEPALVPRSAVYGKVKKEEFSRDDYSAEVTHAPTTRPKPLLTVIVYTYNHQSSIAKCLESLVSQKTDYHYEIHVWDDCSIDGTSDICVRYARKYPGLIKLVVQKENTFVKSDLELQSYAAIRQADSKYFCYIDGDDYWCDENKVQIALDFLESHPEYVGFAHDTLQIDKYNNTCLSHVHEVYEYQIENPVTFSAQAPFFLGSSRVFRASDFVDRRILPIDYKQYYYHLALGPIYYYDKIMACYVIGENSTFASLGCKTRNLNSMFPYYLARMFDFQQDEFCTDLQKKYDVDHLIGDHRYRRLCRLKSLFGVRLGWKLWFFLTFVPKFGPACLGNNFIYSRKAAKKKADQRVS